MLYMVVRFWVHFFKKNKNQNTVLWNLEQIGTIAGYE